MEANPSPPNPIQRITDNGQQYRTSNKTYCTDSQQIYLYRLAYIDPILICFLSGERIEGAVQYSREFDGTPDRKYRVGGTGKDLVA